MCCCNPENEAECSFLYFFIFSSVASLKKCQGNEKKWKFGIMKGWYIIIFPVCFKYLPSLLKTFSCLDAYMQILDKCVMNFSSKSMVTPNSLTSFSYFVSSPARSNVMFLTIVFFFFANCQSLKLIGSASLSFPCVKILLCLYLYLRKKVYCRQHNCKVNCGERYRLRKYWKV